MVVIRWLPGQLSALSSPWIGNAPCCDAGLRGCSGSGRCFHSGTGKTRPSEKLACSVGAHLPVSHADWLSVSVIFDQSCRRSQGRWWTDASPSQRSRCLCSVRSSTKKLTGRYWFPLFRDSLYTWRPKWGHSAAFWHILRVCILKLHPAHGIPSKKGKSIYFKVKCICSLIQL